VQREQGGAALVVHGSRKVVTLIHTPVRRFATRLSGRIILIPPLLDRDYRAAMKSSSPRNRPLASSARHESAVLWRSLVTDAPPQHRGLQ